MLEYIALAIGRLRPGAPFVLEGSTLAGLRFLVEGVVPITEEELSDMVEIIREEKAAIAYRAQRAAEYPAVGDQLDDLYKRGAFSPEMTARIKAVKDKYPKPSSV